MLGRWTFSDCIIVYRFCLYSWEIIGYFFLPAFVLKYLPNEALSNCKVSENMSLQNRKRQREKEKKNPRKEGRNARWGGAWGGLRWVWRSTMPLSLHWELDDIRSLYRSKILSKKNNHIICSSKALKRFCFKRQMHLLTLSLVLIIHTIKMSCWYIA